MRSRAVSFPRACWAAMRLSPPPSLAPARRSSRGAEIDQARGRQFQPDAHALQEIGVAAHVGVDDVDGLPVPHPDATWRGPPW